MINFFWWQTKVLDKLGLVFVGMFKEDDSDEKLLDWPKIFPLKIWVTPKKKYIGKFSVKE
jgi:hypothetical protein